MKPLIFWIGSPFFCFSLGEETPPGKTLGEGEDWRAFEIMRHAPRPGQVYTWNDILQLCLQKHGRAPQTVVVGDNSHPPFLLGVENFPCITACCVVDSHIHSWWSFYAQGFDLCLVSLKDHLPTFAKKRLRQEQILWSPAFAPDAAEASAHSSCSPRNRDCLFVGKVESQTMPARALFFEALQKMLPSLEICQGDFKELYPQAKVVINFCELGDLNFRVFESMAYGAALVTPHIGHGLKELFTPEQDMLLYDVHALEDAADLRQATTCAANQAAKLVQQLLQNNSLCQDMAQNGQRKVLASHLARHRATAFTTALQSLPPDTVELRQNQAEAIRKNFLRFVYLHWAASLQEGLPHQTEDQLESLRQAYLLAALGKI